MQTLLGSTYFLDQAQISLCIRRVLVVRQKRDPLAQQFIQTGGFVQADHPLRAGLLRHHLHVQSSASAPGKRRQVHGHGHGIEFNRLHQRRQLQRNQTALKSQAQHEQIRAHGLA